VPEITIVWPYYDISADLHSSKCSRCQTRAVYNKLMYYFYVQFVIFPMEIYVRRLIRSLKHSDMSYDSILCRSQVHYCSPQNLGRLLAADILFAFTCK